MGSDIQSVENTFGGGAIALFESVDSPGSVSVPRFTPARTAAGVTDNFNAGQISDTRYAYDVVVNGPVRSMIRVKTMNWQTGKGSYEVEQLYTAYAQQSYSTCRVRFTRFLPTVSGVTPGAGIRKKPREAHRYQQGGVVITAGPEAVIDPDDGTISVDVPMIASAMVIRDEFKPEYRFVSDLKGNHAFSVTPRSDQSYRVPHRWRLERGRGPEHVCRVRAVRPPDRSRVQQPGAGARGSARDQAVTARRADRCRAAWPAVWACLAGVALASTSSAQSPRVAVRAAPDGGLVYSADARGNRVIDFSYAGFEGGGVPIPDAPARVVVPPGDGDDGARIQRALDMVAAMPADRLGLRGAVLLLPGRYEVGGSLRIDASGVVLRGSGRGGLGETTVIATGTSRRTLVRVGGRGTHVERPGTRRSIAQAYVPVGASHVVLDDATGIGVGDRLIVHRPSVKAWISQLGMDAFLGWRPEDRLHWQEGTRDITWDRTVVGVDGTRVEIDAPLTTAIDATIGGGSVFVYDFAGRITHAGVEHLRLESAFDASWRFDEDHAWNGIELDAIEHGWVRQVSIAHFAGSAVQAGATASHVTVEDVDARDPVSEVGGFRRRVFVNMGQLSLFQRCSSVGGKHDFVMGFTAAGPNVFRDSSARGALDYSGPLESWSSGTLYDNVIVRGNALRLIDRGLDDQGAGWAAANSVLWNCEATDVEVQSPPGAFNLAYGCKGTLAGAGIEVDARAVPFRDFFRGMAVEPRSLYDAQLRARRGEAAVIGVSPRTIGTDAGDAHFLSAVDMRTPEPATARATTTAPLTVRDGHFVIGEQPAWTQVKGYSWFQAQVPPALARTSGPAITRFAPGRYGPGLTDDLEQVISSLPPGGVFIQHYGLWFDRRRVNHNYDGSAERRTGDVWAPFMELPWARSGEGKAWDGLSTYDLTRFNPWYFDRVASFADLAGRDGRVLYLPLLLSALGAREPGALRRFPLAAGERHPGDRPARRGARGQRVLRRLASRAARSAPAVHPPHARRAWAEAECRVRHRSRVHGHPRVRAVLARHDRRVAA